MVPAVAGPVGFVSVRAGEVAGLMRAYRTAVGSARDTEAVLLDAGVADDLLGVWPGVDDTRCPVVAVNGAVRLSLTVSPVDQRPATSRQIRSLDIGSS